MNGWARLKFVTVTLAGLAGAEAKAELEEERERESPFLTNA